MTKYAKRFFTQRLLPKKGNQKLIPIGGSNIKTGTSKAEKVWLDRLCVPVRSQVIYGLRTVGNRRQPYVVDGYNPVTNTVYEYNGEVFHGSHRIPCKNRDLPDKWLKKSPNQLYNETVNRYQVLCSLGYKVFFVWEYDFKNGKSIGRYYRGRGDNLY